jgi:sRNA-binding carbon storage regulator CsrA
MYLILGRNKGQAIILTTPAGEQVKVIVNDILPRTATRISQVRLAFEAPETIRINREEIERLMQEGNP